MKTTIIIPARYNSSRFEGKPLALIAGRPMIHYVYEQASKVRNAEYVTVATDDNRIFDYCRNNKLNVIMTGNNHQTGTDRIAEVADRLQTDYIINVQGDEPLIEPENIEKCIEELVQSKEGIVSLMSNIDTIESVISSNTTKVVVNNMSNCIYISRSPIPYPRGQVSSYYKQLGIYGFTKEKLTLFKSLSRTKNEIAEEIEFLRLVDNSIPVKFIAVNSKSIGVDSPKDIETILNIIKSKIEI